MRSEWLAYIVPVSISHFVGDAVVGKLQICRWWRLLGPDGYVNEKKRCGCKGSVLLQLMKRGIINGPILTIIIVIIVMH